MFAKVPESLRKNNEYRGEWKRGEKTLLSYFEAPQKRQLSAYCTKTASEQAEFVPVGFAPKPKSAACGPQRQNTAELKGRIAQQSVLELTLDLRISIITASRHANSRDQIGKNSQSAYKAHISWAGCRGDS